MTKECIGQIEINGKPLPFSSAVRANGFIYISGQLAMTPDGQLIQGSIETQTEQVLKNIESVLKKAGASLTDIVKTTIWITDRKDFAGLNAAYAAFFADAPPARSTVVSQLVLDAKVEIEAIAIDPSTK